MLVIFEKKKDSIVMLKHKVSLVWGRVRIKFGQKHGSGGLCCCTPPSEHVLYVSSLTSLCFLLMFFPEAKNTVFFCVVMGHENELLNV